MHTKITTKQVKKTVSQLMVTNQLCLFEDELSESMSKIESALHT